MTLITIFLGKVIAARALRGSGTLYDCELDKVLCHSPPEIQTKYVRKPHKNVAKLCDYHGDLSLKIVQRKPLITILLSSNGKYND